MLLWWFESVLTLLSGARFTTYQMKRLLLHMVSLCVYVCIIVCVCACIHVCAFVYVCVCVWLCRELLLWYTDWSHLWP